MRNFYRLALVSAMTFALALNPSYAAAQARRTTGTTSTSSSSTRTATAASSSDDKSSGTAAATASRQTGTTATASRQNNNTATASRQTSTAATSTTQTSSAASRQNGTTASRQTTTATSASRTGSSSSASTTPSSQVRRTTSTASSSTSSANRSTSGTTASQQAPQNSSTTASGVSRSNANVTASRGLSSASSVSQNNAAPSQKAQNGGVTASQNRNYYGREMKMDDNRNLSRVAPRDRDYMTYDRLGSYYDHVDHYFGYRVKKLPSGYRRARYWGVDYYYHNNVYYRRYGSYYVVCRPPVGIVVDIALDRLHFSTVRFAYYTNVYYEFNVMDSYYRTILEQNRTIARNNALIAQQNRHLALNASRAASAYEIANALGLVQSYAGINTDYYYEDGVFYTVNRKGRYEVIVPPAGALVGELPDDYDIIVLNGVEYYKVDDTVYRLTLVDGIPCLEVLGQMYGSMARKYNYYYGY